MADIELRVVNESGELVSINLDGNVDGKQVLRKEEIEALVNGKFGNWTFVGNAFYVNGNEILSNPVGTLLRLNTAGYTLNISGTSVTFNNLTNELIESGIDSSAITKGWTLAKFTTPADVDGKFGNYSFDGDTIGNSGSEVLYSEPNVEASLISTVAGGYGGKLLLSADDNSAILAILTPGIGTRTISITDLGILLTGLTIAQIDAAPSTSAITKEWTLAKFFQQSQFVNDFTGTSAQPILTDLNGKIASSLLPTQAAPQGNFTPTGGQEYPTLSGNVAGDYWIVNDVGAGYLFVGGDLAGETVYESGWMVLDVNLNWILSNNYSGTVQTAWGSIIGTLSDQTDLNNALGLKADQLDLDTTNSNVSSNTVAIGNKANQSALDATNTNVATNADDIDANTIAIGLRATQADLDTTNTNVSNNATAISGKLDDVTAGTNVSIDKTDPLNPVISATGGGGDSTLITPQNYGCVGDGVADDTANFQLFIDGLISTNETGYLINAKTYLITAPIIIASPVILDGDGSCTIQPNTGAGTSEVISVRNDFSISNVKFNIINQRTEGGGVITLDQNNAIEGTNVVVDGCSMVGGNLKGSYLFSTNSLVDAYTAGAITLKNNDFDNCRCCLKVECLTHGAIQVLNNSFHDYIEDASASNESFCINVGQSGGATLHENALKVSNVLVDGNKGWNYQMNNTGLGNGSMFVRGYASNIVISNNQLSNGGAGVDMSASNNYLTCFYLSGDNMLVTGNVVKDFGFGRGRFCLFKNAITLASTVSKHQRVVNNNIVYRIKDPNTAYGSVMLADVVSYVAENYIVDDYVADSDDSYAISMGHTQSTIDNQAEHGYFRNNFILTNRNALRLGGNLGFSDIVEENIFISTNAPITANRYMITDNGRSTATTYRNNTFTCTNGSTPFYQDYVTPNRDSTSFTGNTFRVSNPDAATSRDMRVFANQKSVGTILIDDNNFILENIFSIGQFANSDVIFSNNKYRADFNLPNVTGAKFLLTAQGDGSGESNFTMENNDIRITDDSTLGGTIFGVQLLAGQTFNNVTISGNTIKGGTDLAKFTYGIYKTTIIKFLIQDNTWTNWGRCIYGYYLISDLTIERDKATNTTDYLYLNGGVTNAMLSGLNITATSNALDLRATIENLSIDRCIFNATTADISLNASGVITNLYGFNNGENYSLANGGTITNVYGANQVDTDFSIQNIFNNIQSVKSNLTPLGALPSASAKQGDMVFVATSATDGDIYVYTGSAWKAITRDP